MGIKPEVRKVDGFWESTYNGWIYYSTNWKLAISRALTMYGLPDPGSLTADYFKRVNRCL